MVLKIVPYVGGKKHKGHIGFRRDTHFFQGVVKIKP